MRASLPEPCTKLQCFARYHSGAPSVAGTANGEAEGTVVKARQKAAHESPKMTEIDDRASDAGTQDEV